MKDLLTNNNIPIQKEYPAYIFMLLLICILVFDLFFFQTLLDLFKNLFSLDGNNLVSNKQPYRTNLHGYISLIYPFLILAYSIFFYKNNSAVLKLHSIHRCIYISISIIISILFIWITYNSLTFKSSCELDYLGVCTLRTYFSTILWLIICISVFAYSFFISRKKINESSMKEEINIVWNSVFYVFITLFFILILWIYTMNIGMKSSIHKYEKYTQDIEKSFEDKVQSEIAKNSIDMCEDTIENIYVSKASNLSGDESFEVHFPSGFVKGVGYMFITRENYWDGNLDWDGGFTRDKFVISDSWIDFSNDSVASFDGMNVNIIVKPGRRYDIRVAIVEPYIEKALKNSQLMMINGFLWRTDDSFLGEDGLPVKISPVFSNERDCITISIK